MGSVFFYTPCIYTRTHAHTHKTTEKVQADIDAPQPANVQQLRSFWGLVNYYQNFLPNLASVLNPFKQLLEQDGIRNGQHDHGNGCILILLDPSLAQCS